MRLRRLHIAEAEDAPEVDGETKIDTVADTALKAEKVDLGQAGIDALMFLISVMIHGTLSKAISRKLLKPAKGLKAANLARKRRFMKMAKAGQLQGKFAAAVTQSVKSVDQVATAIEEGGDAVANNPDVIDGTSAIVAIMEPGEERAKAGKTNIVNDLKETKQIADLIGKMGDVLKGLPSDSTELGLDDGDDLDDGDGDDFSFGTDDLNPDDIDLSSDSDTGDPDAGVDPKWLAYQAKVDKQLHNKK
jgi:hypothetical protein